MTACLEYLDLIGLMGNYSIVQAINRPCPNRRYLADWWQLFIIFYCDIIYIAGMLTNKIDTMNGRIYSGMK